MRPAQKANDDHHHGWKQPISSHGAWKAVCPPWGSISNSKDSLFLLPMAHGELLPHPSAGNPPFVGISFLSHVPVAWDGSICCLQTCLLLACYLANVTCTVVVIMTALIFIIVAHAFCPLWVPTSCMFCRAAHDVFGNGCQCGFDQFDSR